LFVLLRYVFIVAASYLLIFGAPPPGGFRAPQALIPNALPPTAFSIDACYKHNSIAVWTVVLSIVFIKQVYENLAMPEFNTTLMGLLGLSAGTYLGLKIPEPTSPK
jgi:hypothetical protein